MRLLPSRTTLALAAAVAVLLPLSVWASWSAGAANRDKVAAERAHKALDRELNTPVTGLRFVLARCEAERGALEESVRRQNEALDGLRRESDERVAAANRAVAEARGRQRAAEGRARALLNERPRPGEGVCEAADRLILETVR